MPPVYRSTITNRLMASLHPLLRGGRLDCNPLFFHYPHFAWHKSNRPGGAIRSGRYKLIRRYDDNSLERLDLSEEIGETENLATEQPELAVTLNDQLSQWLTRCGARPGNRERRRRNTGHSRVAASAHVRSLKPRTYFRLSLCAGADPVEVMAELC